MEKTRENWFLTRYPIIPSKYPYEEFAGPISLEVESTKIQEKHYGTLRFIAIAIASILSIAAAMVYLTYGATALLIFSMFASVFAAIAFVLEAKMKRRFSTKKGDGGWWTGMVVGEKKVRIRVDWDSCMGAASCVKLAPKNFRLDWEKKKSVFGPAPLELLEEKGEDPERIFFAAQSCPFRAIVLEDEETGERIYP
ncbi:MAG TPA: ferredoxin [Nitrososphaerales archaeon]|nr:ferredoxin [Nitrososphaerales archaeon]